MTIFSLIKVASSQLPRFEEMILTRSKMRILNFLWLKSTENITIFNYIPNTAPQFLQIKNYFHPKLEHVSKTYIRCPRYSDRHCMYVTSGICKGTISYCLPFRFQTKNTFGSSQSSSKEGSTCQNNMTETT